MSLPQQSNAPKVDLFAVEDTDLGVDCTALLTGTQTLINVTTTLTGPDGVVTLPDAPVASGSIVVQRIRAGALTAGQLYQLITLVGISGTTNIRAVKTAINCPE